MFLISAVAFADTTFKRGTDYYSSEGNVTRNNPSYNWVRLVNPAKAYYEFYVPSSDSAKLNITYFSKNQGNATAVQLYYNGAWRDFGSLPIKTRQTTWTSSTITQDKFYGDVIRIRLWTGWNNIVYIKNLWLTYLTPRKVKITFHASVVNSGSHSDMTSANSAKVTYKLNGANNYAYPYDGHDVVVDIDKGSTYNISPVSTGSNNAHRWVSGAASGTADTAKTVNLVFYEQYYKTFRAATVAPGNSMTSSNYVSLNAVHAGVSGIIGLWDNRAISATTDWYDAGSAFTYSQESTGSSATQRWHSQTQKTGTINNSNTEIGYFYHQYKPSITLNGTDSSHTVSAEARTLFGASQQALGYYGSWSDWCDKGSQLNFSQGTTGSPVLTTTDTRGWTVNSAFSATIRYIVRYFTLSGKVTCSETSEAVKGALVYLHNADKSATTDEQGNYTINNTLAGAYTLVVYKAGTAYGSYSELINVNANLIKNISLPSFVTITDFKTSSVFTRAGQIITLTYYLHNSSENSHTVWLGASVTLNGSTWYDYPAGDVSVSVPPGNSTHTRSFQMPSGFGIYDVLVSIWGSKSGGLMYDRYDKLQKNDYVTVGRKGSLRVEVKNESGVPVGEGFKIVVYDANYNLLPLETPNQQLTGFGGVAEWAGDNSLGAGLNYNVEVYSINNEFWGNWRINIKEGNNLLIAYRNMPYVSGLENFYDRSYDIWTELTNLSKKNWIPNPSSRFAPSGQVNINFKIKNPDSVRRQFKISLYIHDNEIPSYSYYPGGETNWRRSLWMKQGEMAQMIPWIIPANIIAGEKTIEISIFTKVVVNGVVKTMLTDYKRPLTSDDKKFKIITDKVPVILVHGVGDNPNGFGLLETLLEAQDYPVESFFYPTRTAETDFQDRNIVDCANELKDFIDIYPSVDIIAHSLGSLVSRAYRCGMTGNLPPANKIHKLIMMATPHFGSPQATSLIDWFKDIPNIFMTIHKELKLASLTTWRINLLDNGNMDTDWTICGTRKYSYVSNRTTANTDTDTSVPLASARLKVGTEIPNFFVPYCHRPELYPHATVIDEDAPYVYSNLTNGLRDYWMGVAYINSSYALPNDPMSHKSYPLILAILGYPHTIPVQDPSDANPVCDKGMVVLSAIDNSKEPIHIIDPDPSLNYIISPYTWGYRFIYFYDENGRSYLTSLNDDNQINRKWIYYNDNLPPGKYTGQAKYVISLTQSRIIDFNFEIKAGRTTFHVINCGQSIKVNLASPDQNFDVSRAGYTITGPFGISRAVDSVIATMNFSDLPLGKYTITYKAVDGYKTPPAETKMLYADINGPHPIEFTGNYEIKGQERILRVPQDYPTIQSAIDAALNGDTVSVSPGIYKESITMKNGVDVIGLNPATTVIQGAGNYSSPVTTDTIGVKFGWEIDDETVLAGFRIKDWNWGLYCYASAQVVRNNIIENNNRGITVHGYPGGGIDPRQNMKFINNVIAFNNGDGFNLTYTSPDIRNNIIVNNSGYGIYFADPSPTYPNLHALYNNVWNNTAGDYYGCTAGTGSLTADPLFIGSGNYHLQPTSPCIDAGDPSILDVDGSRSDMGVFVSTFTFGDDFESYQNQEYINGKPNWTSSDNYYSKGWLAEDGHGKYIHFHPSPFVLFTLDSNYAIYHASAPQPIASLTLDIEYYVMPKSNMKVYISGDNKTWVDVTSALGIVPSTIENDWKNAKIDISNYISDANITTEIYVKFTASASSGAAWGIGVGHIKIIANP